jgi:hypothetical protein
LIDPYLYISTIDLYSQGILPVQIAELPSETIPRPDGVFSFYASWISGTDILIILFKDFPYKFNDNDRRQNKFFIYSDNNNQIIYEGQAQYIEDYSNTTLDPNWDPNNNQADYKVFHP